MIKRFLGDKGVMLEIIAAEECLQGGVLSPLQRLLLVDNLLVPHEGSGKQMK